MLAPFRIVAKNPRLVRLFLGELFSGVGDWLYLVALLVLVYRETSDPLLLGLVGGGRILPYVLLSWSAGVLIDRYERRLILIATDLARAALMAGLAANTLLGGPLLLTVVLAILATCFAVPFRPAIGAYMPTLVKSESELGPANAVYATLGELSYVVGPALAGFIVGATDIGWAFAGNALSFLVPAAMLWTLPADAPAPRPAADDAAPHAPAEDGALLRGVAKPLGGLALVEGVSNFLWGGISVSLVILAVDRLQVGEEATGTLWAAAGVGGVLGALASGAVVLRRDLGPVLLVGTCVMSVGLVGLGLVETLPLALLALVVVATGVLVAQVVLQTVLQRIVPDPVRGRAFGAWQTVSTLTYAGGSFALPSLLTAVGAPRLFGLGGGAMLLAGVGAWLLVGDRMRRSDADQEAAAVLKRVIGLPVFAGTSPAALERAVHKLRPRVVRAGEVILRQGDPADHCYIIDAGEFRVDQRDAAGVERQVDHLGPGVVFGELGLMRGAPRNATVTAATEGRLLVLEGADFLALLNAGPELSDRLLERYQGGLMR